MLSFCICGLCGSYKGCVQMMTECKRAQDPSPVLGSCWAAFHHSTVTPPFSFFFVLEACMVVLMASGDVITSYDEGRGARWRVWWWWWWIASSKRGVVGQNAQAVWWLTSQGCTCLSVSPYTLLLCKEIMDLTPEGRQEPSGEGQVMKNKQKSHTTIK